MEENRMPSLPKWHDTRQSSNKKEKCGKIRETKQAIIDTGFKSLNVTVPVGSNQTGKNHDVWLW